MKTAFQIGGKNNLYKNYWKTSRKIRKNKFGSTPTNLYKKLN